jgi:hypothetical protein
VLGIAAALSLGSVTQPIASHAVTAPDYGVISCSSQVPLYGSIAIVGESGGWGYGDNVKTGWIQACFLRYSTYVQARLEYYTYYEIQAAYPYIALYPCGNTSSNMGTAVQAHWYAPTAAGAHYVYSARMARKPSSLFWARGWSGVADKVWYFGNLTYHNQTTVAISSCEFG